MRLEEVPYLDPYAETLETQNRLPHRQQVDGTYLVTCRLADSLPQRLLGEWEHERVAWLNHHPLPWSREIDQEYHRRFSTRVDGWLDAGHGKCWLRDPHCAELVGDALMYFDGTRTTQLAWAVMPNHVHTLFVRHAPWGLEQLVASWKRFTATKLNRLLQRDGPVWQRDYFDRAIRDESHLGNCVRYVRRNPAKAALRPGHYLLWESELARLIA